MVRPEKLTVPLVVTLKIRKVVEAEELRWIENPLGPIDIGALMSGRADNRVITQPLMSQNSWILKTIVSPECALAARMAPRSEQLTALFAHALATTLSDD